MSDPVEISSTEPESPESQPEDEEKPPEDEDEVDKEEPRKEKRSEKVNYFNAQQLDRAQQLNKAVLAVRSSLNEVRTGLAPGGTHEFRTLKWKAPEPECADLGSFEEKGAAIKDHLDRAEQALWEALKDTRRLEEAAGTRCNRYRDYFLADSVLGPPPRRRTPPRDMWADSPR